MAPFWSNNTCSPYSTPSAPCSSAGLVQYAVNVSAESLEASIADYRATLDFISKRNIRLVIRNTGHDYFGKSTGPGALALWTHYLKDIDLVDYNATFYTGKAFRLGAGVQVFEAYEAATQANLTVVGGDCTTVGIAGGYTQGGGHGPLSSTFGLSADNVLQWEVITAAGEYLVVNPSSPHKDLYWALSGGGGGTYAAVLAVTVRAHPQVRASGATFSALQGNVSTGVFYNVVSVFLDALPALADAGVWSSWLVIDGEFALIPALGPNVDINTLQALLNPTLAALNESGMTYAFSIDEFETFQQAFNAVVPVNNVTGDNIAGRLMPRSVLENNSSAVLGAIDYIVGAGGVFSGVSTNVSAFPSNVENSVNPLWRSTIFNSVIALAWDKENFTANVPLQEEVTYGFMARLEEITPGGGSYINEGDPNQPNFQEAFYGAHYTELEGIKDKYDPGEVFYGRTVVGSERWEAQLDGRLCRN
ncbi:unnamed protein product [Discula destructiva]